MILILFDVFIFIWFNRKYLLIEKTFGLNVLFKNQKNLIFVITFFTCLSHKG